MEAEGRPAGAGRGEGRGGGGLRRPTADGRRSQPSSSPRGRGSRQTRSAGSGAAARVRRSLSDAPTRRQGPSGRGARGLRPPGSRAQRWVAQAGGAATPDTASPKRPPDVGASGVGKGRPGSGCRSGESSEGSRTLKGLLWPCLAERVRGGGLAGKGCGHVALNS